MISIAAGAFAAAVGVLNSEIYGAVDLVEPTLDAIGFGSARDELHAQTTEQMARFVVTAGGVGGEALYRWMAAKSLHPLPGEGYARVNEPIRLFFECFVATTKALAGVLLPQAKHATHQVATQRPPLEETIFETHDGPLARTYANVRDERPLVWNAPGAGDVVTVPRVTIDLQGAERIAGRATSGGDAPTREQFMAMSPEERRPWAHLFGLPDIHNDPAHMRPTSRAPELVGETRAVRPANIPDDFQPGVAVKVTEPAGKSPIPSELRPALGDHLVEVPAASADGPVSEAPQTAAGEGVALGAAVASAEQGNDAPAAEPRHERRKR